ncbi:hypothetical protein BH11PSE11_BH11PSE11_03070 [soil metagenome]
MQLIQILLPLYDKQGKAFAKTRYGAIRDELIARFGGMTSYARAPASGMWKEDDGSAVRDDIVIFEVMAEALDSSWWRQYRASLEVQFQQDVIVIRAHEITTL